MKLRLFAVYFALWAMISASCKKQEVKLTPLASLLITNAVAGGSELQFGSATATIPNNGYMAYGILTGSQVLRLSSRVAPNLVYYNQTKDFVDGGVYSLFLTGTSAALESVFVKEENIPSHAANAFGARVINLVTGGAPISVNLKGLENGSFISSLAYKAVSAFKDISSLTSEGEKVFEFRNAATGELITSFAVPDFELPRFKNITLVFSGAVGSKNIIRVNNY